MTHDSMTDSRPQLLYLSPVVPLHTGNGLAMRAAMVLQVLARHYRVSLLVVRLYAPYDAPIPAEIAHLCQHVADMPAPAAPSPPPSLFTRLKGILRGNSASTATQFRPPFTDVAFDVVHLFRLSMLPFAQPYLNAAERHLDLDDVESITHQRLAALYKLHGKDGLARFEELAAQRAEAAEATVLRDFHRVYVCSESDRATLLKQAHAQVCVIPNALLIPHQLAPKSEDAPFTILFVGTLGYYPNEDAIVFFCTEVLPLIRQAAQRPFVVHIVGTGATQPIKELAAVQEVHLIGAVPDTAPYYSASDMLIVPIRAGGGTRIKVLEAFSYQRPVVSTTLGIEGIAARDEEHVLLGDTPEALAARCVQLMADSQLGERIATNAYRLFLEEYTVDAVAERLAGYR